jgi:hypothetical protein
MKKAKTKFQFGLSHKSIIFIVVIIGVYFLIYLNESKKGGENARLILTGSTRTFSCDNNSSGICLRPNEKDIIATFQVPREMLDAPGNYDPYYSHIRLHVTVDSENIKNKKVNINGIPGPGTNILINSIKPPKTLASIMEDNPWYRSDSSDYKPVPSEIKHTIKYDDLNCTRLGLDNLDLTEIKKLNLTTPQESICFYARTQFYWPTDYPNAFVRCIRTWPTNGKRYASSCRIATLITPTVVAYYSVIDLSIKDSSWIEIDKRIRRFLLDHLIEEG